MKGKLQAKRIYEERQDGDGYRILVDRLWPRGIRKTDGRMDAWVKEIAPTNQLRKRFHEDQDYGSFKTDYMRELDQNESLTPFLSLVKEKLENSNVTLLTASKNIDQCNLSVLMEYLQKKM